jgi:hypothetical protein
VFDSPPVIILNILLINAVLYRGLLHYNFLRVFPLTKVRIIIVFFTFNALFLTFRSLHLLLTEPRFNKFSLLELRIKLILCLVMVISAMVDFIFMGNTNDGEYIRVFCAILIISSLFLVYLLPIPLVLLNLK